MTSINEFCPSMHFEDSPPPRRIVGAKVGDLIREVDGRHEGRVAAIVSGMYCVRWVDTSWSSILFADEIEYA